MRNMFKYLAIVAACYPLGLWALKNPIISGWNPDPAVIRVGSEYFIATSSFEYFPGIPIYKSSNLADWELYSHALTKTSQVQLWGVPTGAGSWAPSISYIHGRFYLATMTRWTYDPVARVWPRVMWISSPDLKEWSDPTWGDPWGIDPSLFQDPAINKTYLNLMSPNNNVDRLWGIYQCEVNLHTGRCIGPYLSLWNGTLPHNSSARPEGPKMFRRNDYYYLLIAEGGTDDLHRSTIARSASPSGPFTPAPNNPLIFNGAWGYDNLTVQSTGHATMFTTDSGDWYATFLARRKINGTSVLGRETFLTTVTWDSDWPVFNDGKPILLSENIGKLPDAKKKKSSIEKFNRSSLDPSWYQLRDKYTQNYHIDDDGLVLQPNVFGLSDRDSPAALLRKQTSLNMTFSARLRNFKQSLGPLQSVGVSVYLSEFEHQDLVIRGCFNTTGNCLFTTIITNATSTVISPLSHIAKPLFVFIILTRRFLRAVDYCLPAQLHHAGRYHDAYLGISACLSPWLQHCFQPRANVARISCLFVARICSHKLFCVFWTIIRTICQWQWKSLAIQRAGCGLL